MATYNDLINIPTFDKKKEEFSQERGEIVFYCRDCQKVVVPKQLHPTKHVYECPDCKGRRIAQGTESSVKEFYSKRR